MLEDVAFKVITGMRTPDHSTIAEFRRRHEAEIAELFDDVLGLCREAGLVSVGVITIDGTKIKANASMDQNRSYSALVQEILREAEETDQREDDLYGNDRGDELPEQLRPGGSPAATLGRERRPASRAVIEHAAANEPGSRSGPVHRLLSRRSTDRCQRRQRAARSGPAQRAHRDLAQAQRRTRHHSSQVCGPGNDVTFSRDGHLLVVALGDGRALLLDSSNGTPLRTIHPLEGDNGGTVILLFSAPNARS